MERFCGLGQKLRALRLVAGLTQEQVAAALGLKGRQRRVVISRLERGPDFNPSLKLVLDYLRACRATPDDLKAILGEYLNTPLVMPASRTAPRRTRQDRKQEQLRQVAAGYLHRQKLEYFIHQELNRLNLPFFQPGRRMAAQFARRLFLILLEDESQDRARAERRRKRAREGAVVKGVPPEVVARLETAVFKFFTRLKKRGELDRLPGPAEAERMMSRPGRRRIVTDEQLCRAEHNRRLLEELQQFQRRREPIVNGALALLAQAGVTGPAQGNYRAFINALVNIARATAPGSRERNRALAHLRQTATRPAHDPALLSRLEEFILQKWDEGT